VWRASYDAARLCTHLRREKSDSGKKRAKEEEATYVKHGGHRLTGAERVERSDILNVPPQVAVAAGSMGGRIK
jgi:hypothetical protein